MIEDEMVIVDELDEGYGGIPVDYEPPEDDEDVADTTELDGLVNQEEIKPGADEGFDDFSWIDDYPDRPLGDIPFPEGDPNMGNKE